jgi:methanogenic corrinoid protein MtbC1
LLFLPEGEHHEIGLLFVYYLLKSHGVNVLYLGTNIPLDDAAYIAKHKKPDYIYSHLTCVSTNFDFDKFIFEIDHTLNKNKIIISGRLTQSFQKKLPAHIQFKKSFTEVIEFVASI